MVGDRVMSVASILSTTRSLEVSIRVRAIPMKILGKVSCYKGGEERKGFTEG
jgi:hypothetical protein